MMKTGPKPMSVRIRGRVFSSAKEAAAHFDVHLGTIYNAIQRGAEETLGVGIGGTTAKAVTIIG